MAHTITALFRTSMRANGKAEVQEEGEASIQFVVDSVLPLLIATPGLVLASPNGTNNNEENYYSTFHKTPIRKKFSKREWQAFPSQSTRKALAEWASSPEFTDWIIKNADRVKLVPDESSDDGMDSGSEGSSEETALENQSGISLLNWY